MSEPARKLHSLIGSGITDDLVAILSEPGPVIKKYPILSNIGYRSKYLKREDVELRISTAESSPFIPYRAVLLERLPVYTDILQELTDLRFTCEAIPKGIALHMLDPVTGNNWYHYTSETYAQLSGCPVELLKRLGVKAVGSLCPPEDNMRATEAVLDAARKFGDSILTPRIFRQGSYKYTRFYGRAYPADNGLIQAAVIAEDYTEQAATMNNSNVYKCANYMLNSFVRAVFDVCFYTDSKFRILDDSPQLRYFFSNDPASSLKLIPLEVFMRLSDDKERFRMYTTRSLEAQAAEDPEKTILPAASMIRLRLALAGDQLTDVQLYATPTYLHGIEGFGSLPTPQSPTREDLPKIVLNTQRIVLNTQSLEEGCMYLVGIRVMGQMNYSIEGGNNPNHRVMENNITPRARSSRKNTRDNAPQLPGLPEESDYSESVASSGHRSSGPVPKKNIIAHAMSRCITRDVSACLATLDLVYDDEVEACDSIDYEWLNPLYDVCDLQIIEEEVVRSLPNKLQSDFLRASREGNYSYCSQILSYCIEGSADILNETSSGKLTEDQDVLHCTFRFFVGMVNRLDPDRGMNLLVLIGKGIPRLFRYLKLAGIEVLKFEFTLALISIAIKHPYVMKSESQLEWLRRSFTEVLKSNKKQSIDKSRSLPVSYYVCVLWAGLMNKLDRKGEARALLENVADDIETYCKRHPEGMVTRQVQGCILHNLAILDIRDGRLDGAFNWIYKLQSVIHESNVKYPKKCQLMVRWAETAQVRMQGGT